MNKLYIIGNGFDISHGVPSKYSDFLMYVNLYHHNEFTRIGQMFGAGNPSFLWKDFENNLGTFDIIRSIQLNLSRFIQIARHGLAWTYHLMGKDMEALPWAGKAVAAFPYKPESIDTLAKVYQGLGRYDDALEQFELCLKLKKEQNVSEERIHETEEKIVTLKQLMNKQ